MVSGRRWGAVIWLVRGGSGRPSDHTLVPWQRRHDHPPPRESETPLSPRTLGVPVRLSRLWPESGAAVGEGALSGCVRGARLSDANENDSSRTHHYIRALARGGRCRG